jgi:hypothetical protein
MFLKNSMRASRSIHARIAFFANSAMTTSVECVLAQKTINAGNLVKNKCILCLSLIPVCKKTKNLKDSC